MTLPPPIANLFTIHTEDEEIRQKGELVQSLILLLTAVAAAHLFLRFINLLQIGWIPPASFYFLGELIIVPIVSVGALLIVRSGRPTIAAHTIFILLNTLIFLALLQADEPHSIPYFMLISIVGIATMASVRASIVYAITIILSISAYYLIRKPSPDYIADIANYILVTLSISLTAWITANRMQKWLRESTKLSHQMKEQTSYLEDRTKQLQRSAAISQSLLNFNTALTTTLDVGEIYRRAARAFSTQLNANLTLITDWNQDNDEAVSQVIYIQHESKSQAGEFNLNPFTFSLAYFPSIGETLKQQTTLVRHSNDPDFSQPEQNFLTGYEQDTCLIVPLTHGSTPLGSVLILRSAAQSEFTQSDIQLAQVMANETAIALNNAMLNSEAQGRVAQLSALNRLSNRLSLAPTLHDIFEGARREVLSLFEATSMSISLVTKDEQHLQWIYAYEYGQELDLTEIPPIPVTRGFSGQVIRTRRRILINEDMAEKSAQLGSVSVGVETAAWLGVPLIVANKIIGVLVIENEHDTDAFDQRAFDLLETIAGSVAVALSNQLQLEEIQTALIAQSEQRVQLETAAEISAATNSILNLTDLLEDAVSLIKERFSLYYTGIFLIDLESNQAVLHAATGEAGKLQLEKGHKLSIGGHSLIGGATNDGRSRITQDVTQDEEWQPNPYLPETRSELALPLRVRGGIIGALTVQSTEPNAFSPELVSILQTMSDQLAIAIDNSRLLAATESRVHRQRYLNQISTQLHNSADTDEIIRVGLKALSEQVNGRSVNLYLGKSIIPSEEKVASS